MIRPTKGIGLCAGQPRLGRGWRLQGGVATRKGCLSRSAKPLTRIGSVPAEAIKSIPRRRHKMKTRLISSRLLRLSFVLTVTISALSIGGAQNKNDNQDNNRNAPVSPHTAIQVPGNPITSSDISWADPGTGRYYFAQIELRCGSDRR